MTGEGGIENTRIVGGGGGGGYNGSQGVISAWQNLNSKRTANTGSGTDSSRLKNWSQVLETEEKREEKNSTDRTNVVASGNVCVCVCVCSCCMSGACMCTPEEGRGRWGVGRGVERRLGGGGGVSVERARSSVSGEVEWLVPANHAATAGRRQKHRGKQLEIYQRQEAHKNLFSIRKRARVHFRRAPRFCSVRSSSRLMGGLSVSIFYVHE